MQHWLDKLTDHAEIQGDNRNLKHVLAAFTRQIDFSSLDHIQAEPTQAVAAYVVSFTISFKAA